jgi:hypothetical protein
VKRIIVILVVYSSFVCCKQDVEIDHNIVRNEDDVVVDMKEFQWKIDISDGKFAYGNLIPHRYKNIVIVAGSTGEEDNYILGVDVFSGDIEYKWLKDYKAKSMDFYDVQSNQRDNLILFQDYDNLFLFDMANGDVKWRNFDQTMSLAINGIIDNDDYFFSANFLENDVRKPYLLKGDFKTGKVEKIETPSIDKVQNFRGGYGTMSPPAVYENAGERFSLFGFTENINIYNNNSSFGYVALYNLSKDKYVYDKVKVGDTLYLHFTERPIIFEEVAVVNASDELFGIDLVTGKTIWHRNEFRKDGEGTFVFQKYDGQFVGINRGGSLDRIIAIDPKTGQNNWEILGVGGDAETFQILDDKLFFVSRGTGRLYVYDLKSQELLIEYESEDIDWFQAWGGMRPFMVDGKLMLVICTYLNAYCYDVSFLLE